MMKDSKILRIGLPVAGAVAVALAAIAVTASAAGVSLGRAGSPVAATNASTPAATAPEGAVKADIAAYCATFTKNFAADLNVSQDAVDAAAKKAAGQTIDQAVSDGKLTADQAAKLKAAIPTGSLCAAAAAGIPPGLGRPAGPGGPGAPGGRMGAGELGAYMNAYLDAAAKAAGLKGGAAELQKDTAAGQSLATIAKANGIDEKTFRSNLITNLTPALDAAVTAGKLTADQEKAILAKLQSGPIPLWNGHPMGPKGTPPSAAPVPPAA